MTGGLPRWRQLSDRLERDIRSGTLAPGTQLPSLGDQQRAGLSQTTTLRAYRELINKGLAVSVHGSGTFVTDSLPEAVPGDVADARLEARFRSIEERLERLEARGGEPQ